MKQFTIALIAVLIGWSAPRAAEFDEKQVDALAAQALKDFEAPGLAIAIVKDDKVLLAKGYGVRQVGKSEPVTENTLFAIASCSKAFTAASIAALIDDKKMKWDDKISQHLPWFRMADPFADREVTLRDALSHRTGLSRHDVLWIKTPFGREDLLRRVAHIPATTSFRSTWEYNNLMFLAAGEAAGRADQSSWETIVQKKIFDPLGMKTANFSTSVAEKGEHARPHRRRDDSKIEDFPWDNIDHIAPAGSINAGVRDLSSWLRLQLDGGRFNGKSILSAATIKEMHTPQAVVRNEGYFSVFFPPDVTEHLSYGLGWFISDYRGNRCVTHGGTLEGFRAQTVLVPKQQLGLVVLTNLGGCRLPEALSKDLLDLLLGLSKRDWNSHYTKYDQKTFGSGVADREKRLKERVPDTKPSLKPAGYSATFNAPDYGDAVVTVENDALQLTWSAFKLKLTHFHFDTFTYEPPYRGAEDRVTFQLDGSGRVKSLTMLGKEFTRRK